MIIKKAFLFFILFILTTGSPKAAELFSVEPPEIYPETEVTIKGAGFSKDIYVVLGNKSFKPFFVTESMIKFNIPANTQPATYRLLMRNTPVETIQISISVKNKEVVVTGYIPQTLNKCDTETEITITGKNLEEIKKIDLNGKEISFNLKDNLLLFSISEDILHNAGNVINIYFYDTKGKIVHLVNIPVISKPFIEAVETSSKTINSQTFRIRGKNFIQGLSLFVNNMSISEDTYENSSDKATFANKYHRFGNTIVPMLDRFRVVSCNEILYTRYPSTPEDKKIDFLIENPGGERSNTLTIYAP